MAKGGECCSCYLIECIKNERISERIKANVSERASSLGLSTDRFFSAATDSKTVAYGDRFASSNTKVSLLRVALRMVRITPLGLPCYLPLDSLPRITMIVNEPEHRK